MHDKLAFKRATICYSQEKAKAKGMTSEQVCEEIKTDYGVEFGARTIRNYVNTGEIGTSPRRSGPSGKIEQWVFHLLCTATESFIKNNQVNGKCVENSRSKLWARVHKVMGMEIVVSFQLLDRILIETAVDMLAKVSDNVEDRRVRWTTYNNLRSCFENWERDLLALGFANVDDAGGTYIPEDQLHRILNVDESCLSLVGSNVQRGGHPEAHFYSPNLPQIGKGTSKCSQTTTLITGRTASGEAIPPHV